MNDTGFFMEILRGIADVMRPGTLTLREQLLFWFGLFLWLQLLRVVYAFLFNGHLLEAFLGTLIKGGLCYWLLYNYGTFFEGLVRYLVQAGLTIGGNKIPVATYLDPGAYIRLAARVTAPVKAAMDASMGLINLGLALGYMLLWMGFFAAFATMAVNVFIWQIELLLASAMGLVLIPLMTFRSTAWAGGGVISFMVNKAFRMGTGAAMVGITFPLVERFLLIPPGTAVSLSRVLVVVTGAWSFCILFLTVSRLAGGMISGVPSMGIGDVVRAAVGTATAGAAVVSGGSSLAMAGVTGGMQAARGAMVAQAAMRGSATPASAGRLAVAAGRTGHLALQQGQRSIRTFADTTRFLGNDSSHMGVRH